MKKLFDETYGDNRTIWYLYEENDESMNYIFSMPDEYGGRSIIPCDYSKLAINIKDIIVEDLKLDLAKEANQTQWIFYSSVISTDAIDDKVRFSIFVRLKDAGYVCNINVNDFIFATSFDEVLALKQSIETLLNQ